MDNAFKSVRTVETEYIGGYMNAYGVQIRFQVSDLLPTTTTGSGIAIAGATPGSSSSGPSQTASSSSSSEGLSTGVQAGIGVGVAVFALIAIVLFWFGFRRARKHRTTVAPAEEDVDQPVHHELKTTPTNPTFGLHEAHVEGAARELPSYPNRPTYELEGSRR